MKRFHYLTCCINARGEAIDSMTDKAHEICYKTMLRNCEGLIDWALSQGYERRLPGLTLQSDWAVSYHKSWYCGIRCYYLRWSAIEFIWTENGDAGRETDVPVRPSTSLLPSMWLGSKDRYGKMCSQ